MSETTSMRSERMRQLRDIVTDVLELGPGELTDTGDFIEDYDADSLLLIDLVTHIEHTMGVTIPDEAVPDLTNLLAALDIVERYTGRADV